MFIELSPPVTQFGRGHPRYLEALPLRLGELHVLEVQSITSDVWALSECVSDPFEICRKRLTCMAPSRFDVPPILLGGTQPPFHGVEVPPVGGIRLGPHVVAMTVDVASQMSNGVTGRPKFAGQILCHVREAPDLSFGSLKLIGDCLSDTSHIGQPGGTDRIAPRPSPYHAGLTYLGGPDEMRRAKTIKTRAHLALLNTQRFPSRAQDFRCDTHGTIHPTSPSRRWVQRTPDGTEASSAMTASCAPVSNASPRRSICPAMCRMTRSASVNMRESSIAARDPDAPK